MTTRTLRALLLLFLFAFVATSACDDSPSDGVDQGDQNSDQEVADPDQDLAEDDDQEELDLKEVDETEEIEEVEETDQEEAEIEEVDAEVDEDLQETDIDEDTEPLCEPACGDFQDCVEGSCVCIEGYGDCNDDPSDGCEEPLNQPLFCGACEPGAKCELPGTLPVCQVISEQSGICDNTCAADHYDLDNDLATTTSNGCEFTIGLLTTYDLSNELSGTVLDVELDGATLFVLFEDTTQHVAAFDLSDGANPVLLGQLDLNSNVGSQASFAVNNNAIAVLSGDSLVSIYVFDGSSIILVEYTLYNNVQGIEALPSPQMPNAIAEFLAYGADGVRRYALFADADVPTEMSCSGDEGYEVCSTGGNGNPSDARLVAMGELNGDDLWTLILGGAASVEYKVEDDGDLDLGVATGDAVDLEIEMAMGWNESFIGNKGAEILRYSYQFDSFGNLTGRTQAAFGALDAAPTSWALLELSDVLVYAHGGGLSLHLLDAGVEGAEALISSSTADELEAAGSLLVSRTGNSVRVFGI